MLDNSCNLDFLKPSLVFTILADVIVLLTMPSLNINLKVLKIG